VKRDGGSTTKERGGSPANAEVVRGRVLLGGVAELNDLSLGQTVDLREVAARPAEKALKGADASSLEFVDVRLKRDEERVR